MLHSIRNILRRLSNQNLEQPGPIKPRIYHGLTLNSEFITAISTVGILIWAIYAAQYSDLAKAYGKNEDLQRANAKAIETNQKMVLQNIYQISRILEAQSLINKDVARTLAATSQISQLDRQVVLLTQTRDALTQEKNVLGGQIAQMENQLGTANAAIEGGVRTIITAGYNRHFSDLDTSTKLNRALVFPTTETVIGGKDFYAYSFLLSNKRINRISDVTLTDHRWYDAGKFAVQARRVRVGSRGMSVIYFAQPEDLSVDDPYFKAFIALLNGPPMVHYDSTAFMLEHEFGLESGADSHVVDIFRQLMGTSPSISVTFIPGSFDEMTYETHVIRMFWLNGFGQTLLQAVGVSANRDANSAIEVASTFSKVTNEGFELDLSAMSALSTQAEKTLGTRGVVLMKQQIQLLDDAWVRQLREDGIPIAAGPHPGVRGEETISPIYHRFDWLEPRDSMSAIILGNIDLDFRVKLALRCVAARFLRENGLAPDVNVTGALYSCERNGKSNEQVKVLVRALLTN